MLSAAESAEPGRYSFDRTPYLRGLIDAVCEAGVEEIVFLKPTQVGGSESERNLLGFFIDNDPGPCLIVMPSEQAAEEMVRDRIRPLLEHTPELARHVSPNREDNTLSAIKLTTMPIFTGWAGSPQSLASKPCRFVLFDEVDKFPPFSGREADPISLATERTQTFLHRKRIVKISTPTTRTGAIWLAWEACGDKRRYFVPCPHCRHEQHLIFPQVKWPKFGADDKVRFADTIEQSRLAWYECIQCKAEIRDHHKPKMMLAGKWVSEGTKSKRVGFHLNSLYSPWKTFSEIAAEFIRAEGDIGLTMNFRNSRMAEPFEEQIAANRPSVITERKTLAPKPNLFPEWAEIAILTADVQKDHLWFVVRAWARGFRSQLIRYGQVLNFSELWSEAFERPMLDKGIARMCEFVGVDGRYRLEEVAEFAKRLPQNISVTQGMSEQAGKGPMCFDQIREGVRYLKIDTQQSKDRLQHMLADVDPTRWRVHAEIGDDYANQLASEHKVFDAKLKRFVWLPKYKGIANHLFDCEANQCAVATWLGMDQPAPKDEPAALVASVPSTASRESASSGNWLTSHRGRY